jgi:hypothetical protein
VRSIVAIGLLVAGGIAVQLTSAYTLPIAVLGFAASVAGWIVVPARGWRRCLAVLPGLLGVAALLSGTDGAPLVALTVWAWLLVRERPVLSWVVLLLPVGVGVGLASVVTQYGQGVVVAAACGAGAISSAILARMVSRFLDHRRPGRGDDRTPGRSPAQSE